MQDARGGELARRLSALHTIVCDRESGEASFRIAIMREAVTALGLRFGALVVLEDGFAIPVASHAGGAEVVSRPTALRELLAGFVAAAGRPIAVGDLLDEPAMRDHPQVVRWGARAYLGVPLRSGGKHYVLTLGSDTPRAAFSSDDVAYAQTLAGLLASSLRAERKNRRLYDLEYFDQQTALPLHLKLVNDLGRRSAAREPFALCAIEVGTARLLEQYGHAVTRRVLGAAAQRLTSLAGPAHVVYRAELCDFAVVAERCTSDAEAEPLLEEIARAFVPPIVDEGREIHLTVRAGIAFSPLDGTTAESLTARALEPLRERGGRSRIQVGSTRPGDLAALRERILADLPGAAERGELFLEYQPFVDAACTRFEGAEALVRWRHPQLGVLSPLQWLPLAEESGAIVTIGGWILEAAARTARRALDLGVDARIAVNVAIGQLRDRAFVERLAYALRLAGVPGSALELEITETAALEDVAGARSVLVACKALGVSVALDDFGTGYSSLAHLRDLPADVVKIDRSFVSAFPHDPHAASIAAAVIPLARGLGRAVQAEGVETVEQLAWLRSEGCDRIQGFLIARPCDESTLLAMLRERPAHALPAAV